MRLSKLVPAELVGVKEQHMMMRFICFLSICLMVSVCIAYEVPTRVKVHNLTAFSKLWGYVKHFYPADEAAEMDWDSFAVYGSKQVMLAKNNKELSKALSKLFQPIVPELLLYTKTKPVHNARALLPGHKTAFWQYEGYNPSGEQSVYRSIRTNRPHKINKNPQNSFVWSNLSPQLPQSLDMSARIRVTLKIRHAVGDTLASEIKFGFNGDYGKMTLSPGDEDEKSFELIGDGYSPVPLWLGLIGFEHLLLDYIRVEEWQLEAWQTVFYSDFSNDVPGALPANFNVSMFPESSYMCSNVDVMVENCAGRYCLSIQKSTSAASFTLGIVDKIFAEYPPFGELLDKQLVPGLHCRFPMVLQCDMEHTYPLANPKKLQQLKQKLYAVDLHDRTDPGVWLAGVIRYWNELQFFYPNFEYNICDWEQELPLCLERVLQSKDFLQYKQALRLLMSKTQDGHAFLSDQSQNSKMPKFNTYPVDGRWIVTSCLDDSLGIELADEVIKMNGIDFSALMQENRPYFLSANPETTDIRLFSMYMKTYLDSVATFTFSTIREAKKYEYTVKIALEDYSGWKWVVPDEKVTHYEGGIVYLNANIITEKELQELMPVLVEAKGIILDLRYYPTISYSLISNLLSAPDTMSYTVIKRYIRPQEELPRLNEGHPTWGLTPEKPHISAKVVALSSRNSKKLL